MAIYNPAFEPAADCMMPVVRYLLVQDGEPEDVPLEALLAAFRSTATIDQQLLECAAESGVMRVHAALSPAACQKLREAVDAESQLDADEVDGHPKYQLNLSPQQLEQLIGRTEARRVWRMPCAYAQWLCSGETAEADAERERAEALAKAADGSVEESIDEFGLGTSVERSAHAACASGGDAANMRPRFREMFIRKYSAETRPWFPFHPDAHDITINIELSLNGGYSGGALLGVYAGAVRRIDRCEGDATLHNSKLLHAVTRMSEGVRYTLIIFFSMPGSTGPDDASVKP